MNELVLTGAEKVWLISDTHFDHENIIRYCNRPFRAVEEMNEVLLQNWNGAVAPDDLVLFLGDMAFGRGSRKPRWWVTQLNGRIVWIKGSHDRGISPASEIPGVLEIVTHTLLGAGGVLFMLVHDFFDAVVNGWDGWVIHGHNHDNQPHLNVARKRVNVSVEVINYTPISLAQIVREVVALNEEACTV